MEFRQMHYLLTVAKHRNITRAAEELYITQSALSLYIQKVESSLGVTLFDRSTTPLSLTQAGEVYMQAARRILQENESLSKQLRDITHHRTGRLRLGTSSNRAAYELPQLFVAFGQRYPGVTVQTVTGSAYRLLEGLRTGEIDLLLLPFSDRYDMRGLCTEQLYAEELVFAASARVMTPEMYADPHTVSRHALETLPYFALNPEHASRIYCENFFKKHRIHPKIQMEFSNNSVCYQMAAAGLGFATVPAMIAELARRDLGMVLLSLGRERVFWDIRMFYRKGAYLGQPERAFIELAKQRHAPGADAAGAEWP